MALTIDHLSIDHVVHVIEAFTDARGAAHQVGEHGLIRVLAFDSRSGEISLTWERDGRHETMVFLLASRTGPGNGRMRQYFEVGDYVAAAIEGRRLIPGFGYAPLAPVLPAVGERMIESFERYDEGIERVWALAARLRFDEAQAQLTAIVDAPDRRGEPNRRAAVDLCASARLHAFDTDLTVYQWLRECGLVQWYVWGAGASSGGDGRWRATEIRAAERAFADLERKLGR